jgi:hypothetical protein
MRPIDRPHARRAKRSNNFAADDPTLDDAQLPNQNAGHLRNGPLSAGRRGLATLFGAPASSLSWSPHILDARGRRRWLGVF